MLEVVRLEISGDFRISDRQRPCGQSEIGVSKSNISGNFPEILGLYFALFR